MDHPGMPNWLGLLKWSLSYSDGKKLYYSNYQIFIIKLNIYNYIKIKVLKKLKNMHLKKI